MTKETLEEFRERVRKEYGPMYFDRQGKEIALMEWGRKCEDHDYKIVKQEEVDKYFISTVWIGLNMQMFRNAPKQIFETMIFLQDEENKNPDDPLHLYQARYSTEEEAIKGHEEALALCRAQIVVEKRIKFLEAENEKDSQQEDLVPLP